MPRKTHSEPRFDGDGPRREAAPPPPKPKRRRVWPYALMLIVAWGAIFGAVFWSHFLSDLPDTTKLMSAGASHDVTILDV